MAYQYFNQDQIMRAARNAIKPGLLLTMATTIVVAVVIYGLAPADVTSTGSIAARFIVGVVCLLWLLFGLTALAHQLYAGVKGEPLPSTWQAMTYASSRLRALLLVPAWGGGLLLALLLLEMLLLALAKIPGIGLVWLALIAVPLLLINTVVAVGLLLALFNIAARIAISEDDAGRLKNTLWQLLRQRLPELLIYNLGGVLVTVVVAAIVLSPLWLGLKISLGLAGYMAGGEMAVVLAGNGFWGGLAHLLGLVSAGILLAAVVSVPAIVISHMTLMVQLELSGQAETATGKPKAAAAKKPRNPRKAATAKAATSRKTARKRQASSEGE